MEKIRAAVCAGSEGGKTFLVAGFSRGFWKRHKMRSLVFDPWRELDWGPGAWVTKDFELWKKVVTGTQGCVAIWDESTANGGRDRENVPLFSEIRHRHPVMFCIGHAYSSILPLMRVNLTDLFLASSDPKDAAEWASVMRDPAVREAGESDVVDGVTVPRLDQYVFMHKRAFRPVKLLRYSKEQIIAGITP